MPRYEVKKLRTFRNVIKVPFSRGTRRLVSRWDGKDILRIFNKAKQFNEQVFIDEFKKFQLCSL